MADQDTNELLKQALLDKAAGIPQQTVLPPLSNVPVSQPLTATPTALSTIPAPLGVGPGAGTEMKLNAGTNNGLAGPAKTYTAPAETVLPPLSNVDKKAEDIDEKYREKYANTALDHAVEHAKNEGLAQPLADHLAPTLSQSTLSNDGPGPLSPAPIVLGAPQKMPVIGAGPQPLGENAPALPNQLANLGPAGTPAALGGDATAGIPLSLENVPTNVPTYGGPGKVPALDQPIPKNQLAKDSANFNWDPSQHSGIANLEHNADMKKGIGGFFAKLGAHALGGLTDLGDVVAPEFMERVPGTPLDFQIKQQQKGAAAAQALGNLKTQSEINKANAETYKLQHPEPTGDASTRAYEAFIAAGKSPAEALALSWKPKEPGETKIMTTPDGKNIEVHQGRSGELLTNTNSPIPEGTVPYEKPNKPTDKEQGQATQMKAWGAPDTSTNQNNARREIAHSENNPTNGGTIGFDPKTNLYTYDGNSGSWDEMNDIRNKHEIDMKKAIQASGKMEPRFVVPRQPKTELYEAPNDPADSSKGTHLVEIGAGGLVPQGAKRAGASEKPPTADEIKRAEMAENLTHNIDQLEDIATRRPELFGPMGGRLTQLKQVLGSDDPDVAALDTIAHQLGMAQISAHSMRSAQGVEAATNSLLNSFHNSASATKIALSKARSSVASFQKDFATHPGAAAQNPAAAGQSIGGQEQTGPAVGSSFKGSTIKSVDPDGTIHTADGKHYGK